MSSRKAALKKARKLVKSRQEDANCVKNKYIIAEEYDDDPKGTLVIILADIKTPS